MKILLFWWSFEYFYNTTPENYGDLLSKYLVECIAKKPTTWVQPKKQKWFRRNKTNYLAIGSILAYASKHSVVWGSGIIEKNMQVAKATFLAVRGPETRERLLQLGYECPAIYGDPAILLPNYFQPEVKKKFTIGIVPHYVDYALVREWYKDQDHIKVINFRTNDVEKTTREILSCSHVISSSLHGLIVSHAYAIPAVWVQFSNKLYGDNIKFKDYFESVGLKPYSANFISKPKTEATFLEMLQENHSSIPDQEKLREIRSNLMRVCPFN
jgi:hypothetical protein